MKLHQFYERVGNDDSTRAEKQELNNTRAKASSDLKDMLDKIRDEKDLDTKKSLAKQMATAFTAGGKAKFIASVDGCKSAAQVDGLAYNAALKGEGHGTKLA